jgi:hypothetical protein
MTYHTLYENCEPNHPEALQRLEEMRGAGMDRVLNYWAWNGSNVEILAYAAAADWLGLRLIWPSGGTPEQINLVKDHPATWGFYIGEEARGLPHLIQPIESYAALVAGQAPDAHRLYVEWGMGITWPTLRDRLRQFVSDTTVLAADYYPVGVHMGTVAEVADCAAAVKQVAQNNERSAAMTLQAFSWASEPELAPPGAHQWPTEQQMRQMRQLVEGEGIRHILWFDYYFIRPPGSTDYSKLDRLSRALSD